MKGVAVALVLAAAASQQTDGFLLAKLPASKAQQAWVKHSLQQRCVFAMLLGWNWVGLDRGQGVSNPR